jgi:hypothetical protein
MALSTNALKLMKALYWILLSLVQLYICYLLFTTNRAIAGILWLILGFIIIYVVYPYYFPPGDPGSHWPPYITACPDYLTMISGADGRPLCVDYVGLNSPLLKKSDPALPPAAGDSAHVFDPSGTVAQKAAKAQQYGLSWEGVH